MNEKWKGRVSVLGILCIVSGLVRIFVVVPRYDAEVRSAEAISARLSGLISIIMGALLCLRPYLVKEHA